MVVEGDGCGEGEEALGDACAEVVECPRAVAFEAEGAFEGPEDRFDALSDWGEVDVVLRFVFASGPDDRRVELGSFGGELAAGVALVADHRFAARPARAGEHFQGDSALVAFGEASVTALGVPSGANRPCNRNPQNMRLWEAQ